MRTPRPKRRKIPLENFESFTSRLSDFQTKTIDGEVLSVIATFVYEIDLDIQEIRILRIRDILDAHGRVRSEVSINGKITPVSSHIRDLIPGYIEYLKQETGRRIMRKSPLFPNWKNNRHRGVRNPFYTASTLKKHIRQAGWKIRGDTYGWDQIKFGKIYDY